ncbi:7339_t:CDS:2 [Entrophospora sp. SA101]|nr:7339_t:CDS:2 [Entrophospora sp. SA101]
MIISSCTFNTILCSPDLASGKYFDRVITIVLENTDYTEAIKDKYLSYLANQGILLSNFHGVWHPSQPNYIAMIRGSKGGVVSGGFVGEVSDDKLYYRKHNPFISMTNIRTNPSLISKISTRNMLKKYSFSKNNKIMKTNILLFNKNTDNDTGAISKRNNSNDYIDDDYKDIERIKLLLKSYLNNYDIKDVNSKVLINEPWYNTTDLLIIPNNNNNNNNNSSSSSSDFQINDYHRKIKNYVYNEDGKYLGIGFGAEIFCGLSSPQTHNNNNSDLKFFLGNYWKKNLSSSVNEDLSLILNTENNKKIKIKKTKILNSIGYFENTSKYSNISTIAYIKENDDDGKKEPVIIKYNNIGKCKVILSGIDLFNNDLYSFDDRLLLLNLIFSELEVKFKYDNDEFFNFKKFFNILCNERSLLSKGDNNLEFGSILLYGEVVTSTQTILESNLKLKKKLPNGFIFLTNRQIQGRGRGKNTWISPLGCLQFSFTLNHYDNPTTSASVVFIQYLLSLAIVESIRTKDGYEEIPLRLKWPNDIYAFIDDNEFVKIGGVLVNSNYINKEYKLVIGCGLNVNNQYPTISINQLIEIYNKKNKNAEDLKLFSQEELLAMIIVKFEYFYKDFCNYGKGFRPFIDIYYKRWLHE